MNKLGLVIAMIVVVGFASMHHKPSASTKAAAGAHANSAPGRAAAGSATAPTPMAVRDKAAQEAAIRAGMPAWPTVSRQYGPAKSMASTGDRNVALTFDDGPSGYTNDVLDLLDRYHVKATFCVIGDQVQSAVNVIQRIVSDGHTLCNHSWSHDETLGCSRHDDHGRPEANERSHSGAPCPERGSATTGSQAAPSPAPSYASASNSECDRSTGRWIHRIGPCQARSRSSRSWPTTSTAARSCLCTTAAGDRAETLNALRTLLPWLSNRFRLVPLPVS